MSNTETKSGRGRPKGSVNTGGNIVERMSTKVKDTMEFFDKLSERVTSWAAREEDSNRKEQLTEMSDSLTTLATKLNATVGQVFSDLVTDDWKPSVATSSGAIDYSPGRQVWLKDAFRPDYIEMEFSESDLNNLVVINTVKGKVMVAAGKSGKNRFPIPKLHLTVTNPDEATE